MAAGEPLGITPYGTETLHVLRAEKGYPIIGQETDGTVTPDDLGLGRAGLDEEGLDRATLAAAAGYPAAGPQAARRPAAGRPRRAACPKAPSWSRRTPTSRRGPSRCSAT